LGSRNENVTPTANAMTANSSQMPTMRYLLVTMKPGADCQSEAERNEVLLQALASMLGISTDHDQQTECQNDNIDSDAASCSSSSSSSTTTSTSNEEVVNTTIATSSRQEEPLNEYDQTARALCCAWPDIFLFGTAYKRQVANLSTKQKHHLLNQFTCHAATSRELIAYLYDAQMRNDSNRGMSVRCRSR
jgi:hypothetical protein